MYFVKKDLSESEDTQLYLGAFIRYERESENMTLGFMADVIGITKSYLSDIEHGKKKPSEYAFNKIMSTLGIDFNDSLSLRLEMIDKLEKMYLLYTELNKEEMKEIIDDLNNNYEKYYNSYAFLTCEIMRLVYALTVENNMDLSKLIMTKVDMFDHLLSKEEASIYYDMKGLYAYKVNDLNAAQEYFEKAYEQTSSICTKGMVCYHLALLYQGKNNQIDSLLYCERAIEHFSKNYNIFRLLYLELYKGTCYSRERIYDKAINIYENVVENSIKNNYSRITNVTYHNMAWTYMKAKKYTEVIQYTNLSFELDAYPSFDELYVYLPYSYFKLGEYQESLKLIDINKDKLKKSIHLNFLDAIEAKIKNDDNGFIHHLEKYVDCLLDSDQDIDMLTFVYNELIEYYTDNHKYQELSMVYSHLVKLYDNHL